MQKRTIQKTFSITRTLTLTTVALSGIVGVVSFIMAMIVNPMS